MQARLGGWRLETRVFHRNRDVEWGDRSSVGVRGEDTRLLETGREGVAVDLLRLAGHSGTVPSAIAR